MNELDIGGIDIAIMAVYVVAVLGLGLWVGRARRGTDHYFLGGRQANWLLIGLTLTAVNMSGTSLVGLAGSGYEEGIAVWNYEWMAAIVLAALAVFIVPIYIRSRVSTTPEFFERRYDGRFGTAFAGLNVLTALFIDAAGALFVGGLTLKVIFPGVPLTTLIVAAALLGATYVLFGGLTAVHVTDTVQMVVLLAAATALCVMTLGDVGWSWSRVEEIAPEGGTTVAPPADDQFLPWPGIFTGVIWLGIYFWMTNHMVIQNVLSAKTIDHGRKGALLSGAIQVTYLLLLILPGVIARDLYPDIAESDMVWPTLAFDYLPVGLAGISTAALVAALMSTLDSVLNGAASIVTNDFIRRRRPDIPDQRLLLIGRLLVLVFLAVAVIWAPQIDRFPTIVEYFQSFLGHVVMPVVVVFLGGLLWRRGTATAAFLTLVVAAPIGLVAFVAGEMIELYNLQFLYATGLMFALSVALYVGVSLRTEPPDPEQISDVMWSRDNWDADSEELRDVPWYRNFRVQALVVVVATLVAVALFI